MNQVAIIGAGGMGTALALLFARGGAGVRIWARDKKRADRMRSSRENALHLPGIVLPESIEVTSDIGASLLNADLALVAVPTSYLRGTLGPMASAFPAGLPVLSVVKGIENQTFSRPSQIIAEVLGPRSISILSGPSHAEELAKGLPASVVVAGEDEALNVSARDALNQGMFRVYTNPDALGVELAGALKNILGIAAGVSDGLGLGDNAKSALLTRGLAEITRFGVSLGATPETFFGLAGVGDVITTCFSPFGRNRQVGHRIGKGERLDEILSGMVNVAEGVPTTLSVHHLAASRGVEVPITSELHAILFEGKPPRDALLSLMDRMPKPEWVS